MKSIWKTLLCCLGATVLLAGCQTGQADEPEEVVVEKEQPEDDKETSTAAEEQPQGSDEDDSGLLKYVEPAEYAAAEGIELEPGTYIAVVGKGKDGIFWKLAREGATRAVADLNEHLGYTGSDKVYITYDAPGEEENVDQQINVLDEALGSYPDAVSLAVVDVQAFQTQFDYMVENSIPVVAFDSGVDNENLLSLSATDNAAAAETAAEKLCELIGGKGQIAMLMHNNISETGIARENAFLGHVKEQYPDVQIVDISYMNEADQSPEELVSEVLERYPDLKGYFASNAATDEIVRRVCIQEERDIRKVSFDGTQEQITAIEHGELDGVVVQNPYAMGYTSVIAAARAIMEMESDEELSLLDPFINTGCMWIDGDNLEEEEIQAYISY